MRMEPRGHQEKFSSTSSVRDSLYSSGLPSLFSASLDRGPNGKRIVRRKRYGTATHPRRGGIVRELVEALVIAALIALVAVGLYSSYWAEKDRQEVTAKAGAR